MLKIHKTRKDGSVKLDVDQETYVDILDFYDNCYNQNMKDTNDEQTAEGGAVLSVIEYAVNLFLFHNPHVRMIKKDEYPK